MTLYIRLHDIPDELTPGDKIPCTVEGQPYNATFLRYGEDGDGNEWKRLVWVEIRNLLEKTSGVVQPDMFGSLKTEFVVNADRTAGTGFWQ